MEHYTFKLIIRAPNQFIEDQIIFCNSNWKVKELKNHLSKVYPYNPDPASQKLIYCGRLLDNSFYLENVLRLSDSNEEIHIMHLTSNITSHKAQKNIAINADVGNHDDILLENYNLCFERFSLVFLSLDQRYQLNNHQIIWITQAYKYYLLNYFYLLSTHGFHLSNKYYFNSWKPFLPCNSNRHSSNNNFNDNHSINNRNEQQRININLGQMNNYNNLHNDNLNDNANDNAREDIAFGNNRDWLDNFYMLSRVLILFSIVYFYSTPLRFVIVTFLGFLIYLYHNGFFRTYPVLLADNNNANIDNYNEIPENENRVPVDRAFENQQENQNEPPIRMHRINEEERPGALAFTWIFFSSFFASLVPDQPNIV